MKLNELPTELVLAIADELDRKADIWNFRLVNKRLAAIGYIKMASRLQVVNVVKDLTSFSSYLRAIESSPMTRHLVIYHATWSVCDYDIWKYHPLLLEGRERQITKSSSSYYAYMQYKKFIQGEASRDLELDAKALISIIARLPNLRCLKISSIKLSSWSGYYMSRACVDLRRRIWLAPSFRESIHPSVSLVLQILAFVPYLERLDIAGPFYSTQIIVPQIIRASTVTELNIQGLIKGADTWSSALKFLVYFPEMSRLRLTVLENRGDAFPFDQLVVPKLKELSVSGVCATSTDIISFITYHQRTLIRLNISNTVLLAGSWKAVLKCLRQINATRRKLNIQFSRTPLS
jgi:hypothetical protein